MPEASRLRASENRARALPSGMVAFLFTDIEGSTQRWERHHDAMDVAVKRHDAVVRGAIESHDGHVFKTVGDAFCSAFARVSDAVRAAIDIQRGLASEDFAAVQGVHVRAGLHIGEASERDGDYFGPAVNRVARLMSIGHGGQVLLSGNTREVANANLPAGTSLIDLGLRRLKDLTEPEHVWQLSIEGLPREFPPLASLDARPNNLPLQVSRLIGRESDIDDAKSLLAEHRLVTLLGAGGVGKTRLALQASADQIDHYTDGVWFADLAPIRDPELVSSVVAQALNMTQKQDRRVDDALLDWLKRKQLLLILDNCEHLVETVARLADGIVRSCPNVRVLATSRQALNIDGEVILRLPSLGVPEKVDGMRAADALQYGAIALFVERAAAADRRFVLSDDNASIVADISRRLDGIPLAIELAAARVKVLSIPNIARRLDDRFKILTGGSRTALPRQKTLTALIGWSYDLLSTQEQMLLARVAIFAGGFGLDAATAVCGGEGIDATSVLDLLSSLADKSLVVADTSGEQERYRLLESTRAFALEKLTAANDRERLTRSHALYFRELAQAADEGFFASPNTAWLSHAELELDNYRAALAWAVTDGKDVPLGAAIAAGLDRLWSLGGLMVEGRYWMALAQAGLDETEHAREAARLWLALANLSHAKPKHDQAVRALTLYESLSDHQKSAWAMFCLAFALYQMGRIDEANRECERTLAAMRELGERRGIAAGFNLRALICRYPGGDFSEARSLFAQAIEIHKSLGDGDGATTVLGNLAELEFLGGDVVQALALVREAIDINIRGKNAVMLALDHTNLAAYCIAAGDLEGAREAAREGLKWALQGQHTLGIAIVLQHFALLLALRNHVRAAAQLLGYVNAQFQVLGYGREYTEQWSFEKLMNAIHEHLGESEIATLAAEGAAWTEDRAVEIAMSA